MRAKAPLAFVSLLLLCGCSKLAVFEPENVDGRLSYDDRLEAPIAKTALDGASLENGRIVSRKKTTIDRLDDGFYLLSIDGGYAIAADRKGALMLYGLEGKPKRFDFAEAIVSAATDGKIIVAVSKTNACRVIDAQNSKTLFFSREKSALAVSDKLAKPLIGKQQAIIPTLDGKLLIVDRAAMKIAKEIALGDEEFFGNVVFLAEYDNHVIAAVDGRATSIAANGARRSRDIDARTLAALPSGLYIFARDGAVERVSAKLETIAANRLPYARFIAAAEKDDAIWAVEQSGYVVKFTDDLKEAKIYELPDTIRASVYIGDQGAWHYDRLVRWR
ncbi:MAG: hypothetical protein LBO72_02095 [Helicobacteraceae bacterium]|nr:hypothetical protein [Helicobacteraceae bacterium]